MGLVDPLSWKSICRNDSLLDLIVGEDAEYVLNLLPVALSKNECVSILGVVVDSLLTVSPDQLFFAAAIGIAAVE